MVRCLLPGLYAFTCFAGFSTNFGEGRRYLPEPTSARLRKFLLEIALPFMGLAAIFLINSWAFQKIFSTSITGYLNWYVNTGPFINLAVLAFGAAWSVLDNNVGLVSAHPLIYIRACRKLAGLPIYAFGGHLRRENHEGQPLLDLLFGMPLIVLFVVASFAWLVLVAPLQYFLFLVCGAPSRIALRSHYRLRAEVDGEILSFRVLTRCEPDPESGWEASMRDKPVTLANAFGAATLFMIGYLWR